MNRFKVSVVSIASVALMVSTSTAAAVAVRERGPCHPLLAKVGARGITTGPDAGLCTASPGGFPKSENKGPSIAAAPLSMGTGYVVDGCERMS